MHQRKDVDTISSNKHIKGREKPLKIWTFLCCQMHQRVAHAIHYYKLVPSSFHLYPLENIKRNCFPRCSDTPVVTQCKHKQKAVFELRLLINHIQERKVFTYHFYQYLCTCGSSMLTMLASGNMLCVMYSYYCFSSNFGYIFLRSSSLFNAGGRLALTYKCSIYTTEDSGALKLNLNSRYNP